MLTSTQNMNVHLVEAKAAHPTRCQIQWHRLGWDQLEIQPGRAGPATTNLCDMTRKKLIFAASRHSAIVFWMHQSIWWCSELDFPWFGMQYISNFNVLTVIHCSTIPSGICTWIYHFKCIDDMLSIAGMMSVSIWISDVGTLVDSAPSTVTHIAMSPRCGSYLCIKTRANSHSTWQGLT